MACRRCSVGSCVDNARLLEAATEVVLEGGLGDDLSDVPVVGLAPEWMSEKAVAIGCYFVASGIDVILGHPFHIAGSENVTRFLNEEARGIFGASFHVHADPVEAAEATPSPAATVLASTVRPSAAHGHEGRRELASADLFAAIDGPRCGSPAPRNWTRPPREGRAGRRRFSRYGDLPLIYRSPAGRKRSPTCAGPRAARRSFARTAVEKVWLLAW